MALQGAHGYTPTSTPLGAGPLSTEQPTPSHPPLTKSHGMFLKHSDSSIFLPIPQKHSSPLNLSSEPSCIISRLWKCRHKTVVFLLRGKDGEMDVQTCQVALILIFKFFGFGFDLLILTYPVCIRY